MSDFPTVLTRPSSVEQPAQFDTWLTACAERLLNGCDLLLAGEKHRFAEIEAYYHGQTHRDPFAHCDPVQLERGRWYFHRTRGVYRGGSFKGVDLAFGDGSAFGGFLIRSIARADGTLIDGPSLCVDHLLTQTGTKIVGVLDRTIGSRLAWDNSSPLHLEWLATPRQAPILRTARVGLTLKKASDNQAMPSYILRPYRYLTEPRRISKGKPHMVLALHLQGKGSDLIHQQTGCPKASINRYLEDLEAGGKTRDFTPYLGIDLGTKELCQLHGTWQEVYCSASS